MSILVSGTSAYTILIATCLHASLGGLSMCYLQHSGFVKTIPMFTIVYSHTSY